MRGLKSEELLFMVLAATVFITLFSWHCFHGTVFMVLLSWHCFLGTAFMVLAAKASVAGYLQKGK
jgi:hypothetical protein